MEFFKRKTSINFMGLRKATAVFSAFIFIACLVSLWVYGLNWGLDFTGGMQLQVKYQQPVDLNLVRSELARTGFTEAVVQSYGTTKDVLISIAPKANQNPQQLETEIMSSLPGAELQRIESVGPEVGQELATKGALSIIVALILTMIYIAMRFEYRFAVGAVVALIHDPVLILGIFSFFHLEFNLVALAAILAVIGYSLNDTIVIFDRVRENFRKVRHSSALEVMNLSINQTLSRTVMTSATTLVVVSALFFYGGEMIHNFATALMIGIIIGTYSSIYVAGALAVALGLSRKDLLPKPKAVVDDRP